MVSLSLVTNMDNCRDYYNITSSRYMTQEYVHDKTLYMGSHYGFCAPDRATYFVDKVRTFVYLAIIAEGLTAGSDFAYLKDIHNSATFKFVERNAIEAYKTWSPERFTRIRLLPLKKEDADHIWVNNGHSSTSWELSDDTQMYKHLASGKIVKIQVPNFHQHDAERFLGRYDMTEILSSTKCGLMYID